MPRSCSAVRDAITCPAGRQAGVEAVARLHRARPQTPAAMPRPARSMHRRRAPSHLQPTDAASTRRRRIPPISESTLRQLPVERRPWRTGRWRRDAGPSAGTTRPAIDAIAPSRPSCRCSASISFVPARFPRCRATNSIRARDSRPADCRPTLEGRLSPAGSTSPSPRCCAGAVSNRTGPHPRRPSDHDIGSAARNRVVSRQRRHDLLGRQRRAAVDDRAAIGDVHRAGVGPVTPGCPGRCSCRTSLSGAQRSSSSTKASHSPRASAAPLLRAALTPRGVS